MPIKYWKYNSLNVVKATHPKQKNFSENSRGRAIHLRKPDNKKATLCNLFVTEHLESAGWSGYTEGMIERKQCLVCFKDGFVEDLLKAE